VHTVVFVQSPQKLTKAVLRTSNLGRNFTQHLAFFSRTHYKTTRFGDKTTKRNGKMQQMV